MIRMIRFYIKADYIEFRRTPGLFNNRAATFEAAVVFHLQRDVSKNILLEPFFNLTAHEHSQDPYL